MSVDRIECTSTHCERRQECASPSECTGNAAGKASAVRQKPGHYVSHEALLEYEERILAAEMEAVRLGRELKSLSPTEAPEPLVERGASNSQMLGPFSTFQSTAEPDRWYVGNDRVAYFATEIGASNGDDAKLVAELLNQHTVTPKSSSEPREPEGMQVVPGTPLLPNGSTVADVLAAAQRLRDEPKTGYTIDKTRVSKSDLFAVINGFEQLARATLSSSISNAEAGGSWLTKSLEGSSDRFAALPEAIKRRSSAYVEDSGEVIQADDGPQPLPIKFTCEGCKHFSKKYWKDHLENDETDSGWSANCAAAERSLGAYWSATKGPPDWCPRDHRLAARQSPDSLVEAAKELRDDLLMRGEKDEDGTIIVNASFGRWLAFCKAIDAASLSKSPSNGEGV